MVRREQRLGRGLGLGESNDEEGLEPKPGQGQGRDLILDQPMNLSQVPGQRLGQGQVKDWDGA